MKTKIFLSILALGLIVSAFGQKPTLELSFTAIDSASYLQIDSIKVINRTQGCDTVLHWPDTVLILDYQIGITKINNGEDKLHLFQNYPNPLKDQTTIILYIPKKDKVGVMISDILGRKVIATESLLEKGYHSFRFIPSSGEIFFFTAYWNGTSSSIKILSTATNTNLSNSFYYLGSYGAEPHLKSANKEQRFEFNLGDELLYLGFEDTLQSGMLDVLETSTTYTFQFAYNIPCPGTPSVIFEGQVYNTVQIFNQCWLKENLNYEAGNSWCYNNDPANCATYGRLYDWETAIGVCPSGWHLPSDDEWKILEGTVDSQYPVGDPEWNGTGWRGIDASYHLKSTTGWYSNGNGDDSYGFSALPGGYRYYLGSFYNLGDGATFWSSTEYSGSTAWYRGLSYINDRVNRYDNNMTSSFSTRCLRD